MKHAILFIILLVLVPVAIATPSGLSVSGVTNNAANFTASNTGDSWFEYGMSATTLNVWTPNQSASGSYTWTEYGSPLTSGRTYYVAACDSTGCTSPSSFTLSGATPLPTTTFGYMISNLTQNKGNTLMFVMNWLLPYAWLFPLQASALAISIVTALALFAVFWGMAARTKGVAVPIIVCVIAAPYLLYANQGMHLGIPSDFLAIAQGIFYAGLAGIILIIMRK
jgi:hypothetical protein